MSHPHDQLARYVDGELDGVEAEALLQHVAQCAECGDALYDVVRAGSAAPPADTIPLDTFAQLERRNDLHGVAAAFVLVGNRASAAAYLERAAPGPDVAADRALLQLSAGHAQAAVIALDG